MPAAERPLTERLRALADSFRRKPAKTSLGIIWLAVKALCVFWFRTMLAAGLFAMAFLYVIPMAGDVAIDLARVRSMCVLLGFTAVFGWICFRTATRMMMPRHKTSKTPENAEKR